MIKQRKLNCLFFCYEEETRTLLYLLMIQTETLINDFFSFLRLRIDDLPLWCVYKADSSWHNVYISIIICSNQQCKDVNWSEIDFNFDAIESMSCHILILFVQICIICIIKFLLVSHAKGKSKDDLSIIISCFRLSCFPKANY